MVGVTATAGLSGNICMGASAVAAQTWEPWEEDKDLSWAEYHSAGTANQFVSNDCDPSSLDNGAGSTAANQNTNQHHQPDAASFSLMLAICVNEISQKFSQYLENAPTSTLFLLKEFTSACASFIMVSSPDIGMLNVCLQRSFRWTHCVSAPFTAVGEGNSRPHLQFLWKLSRNYIDTSNACRVQCDSFQSNLLSDGLLV